MVGATPEVQLLPTDQVPLVAPVQVLRAAVVVWVDDAIAAKMLPKKAKREKCLRIFMGGSLWGDKNSLKHTCLHSPFISQTIHHVCKINHVHKQRDFA